MTETLTKEWVASVHQLYSQVGPYSNLSSAVYDLVEQPQYVFFSIFHPVNEQPGDSDDEYQIAYPDLYSPEPVLTGECKFTINDQRFSPELVVSETVVDPDWRTILNCCNTLLSLCPDRPIGFLCDIIPAGEGVYELLFAKEP